MRGPVLVTGGAGYIGSVCAHALHAAGRDVVVLDDLSTGHRAFVRWGPLVEGDVGDAALMRDTLERHRIAAVMHFAAKTLVAESVTDPQLYDRWNRGKTRVLASVAAASKVGALVFSSSCAVYGAPRRMPIDEEAPLAPLNPYGISKMHSEEAVRASGVPAAILRYFNAAGGAPDLGLGERHEPETHLIPLALRAAREQEPLSIFGSDYPTQDGTCIRDYVHVKDLASAHLAALEHLERGAGSGTWNLGVGRGHSVLEVLSAVERVTGVRVPRRLEARREGDPPVLVASPERARRDLRWRTAHSDLRTIIEDAAAFGRAVL